MPVLAIRTAHSDTTAAKTLSPYADNMREAFAPTGHFVAEEDPEWLVATLDDFLTATED